MNEQRTHLESVRLERIREKNNQRGRATPEQPRPEDTPKPRGERDEDDARDAGRRE